jgi:acyl carrier protein phosphodiesterase
MNYLSHIYLSGESEEIRLGNFIGDFVKGRHFMKYPPEVAKGILLHRQIDSFTDSHLIINECVLKLRPGFGKHSGIVIDIFLDHFLAVNWHLYSFEKLSSFTKRFHAVLLSNFFQLPSPVKMFIPFLIQNKRLQSYASFEGIEKTLRIMVQHTSLPAETEFALKILEDEYMFLNNAFHLFFTEIIHFIETKGDYKIERPVFEIEKYLEIAERKGEILQKGKL